MDLTFLTLCRVYQTQKDKYSLQDKCSLPRGQPSLIYIYIYTHLWVSVSVDSVHGTRGGLGKVVEDWVVLSRTIRGPPSAAKAVLELVILLPHNWVPEPQVCTTTPDFELQVPTAHFSACCSLLSGVLMWIVTVLSALLLPWSEQNLTFCPSEFFFLVTFYFVRCRT